MTGSRVDLAPLSHWLQNRYLILLLLSAPLYALAAEGQLDLNLDSPRYVLLARGIATGAKYLMNFGVRDYPETQAPFAYPFILSPLVRIFGPKAFYAFEALSVFCMLLAVYGITGWLRRILPASEAPAISILCASLAVFQHYAVSISTESSYLAVSFFCLWTMERVLAADSISPGGWVLLFLSFGMAFHLRLVGIILPFAFCVTLLLRRRFITAIAGAIVGFMACIPWLAHLARFGMGYSGEFVGATPTLGSFLYRICYNAAADTTKALPDLFFYPFLSSILPYEPLFLLKAAIGAVLLTIIVRGCYLRLRGILKSGQSRAMQVFRRISVSEIYVLAYVGVCLSWTTHGARYLLPIVPILVALLLKGASRYRIWVCGLIVSVALCGCAVGIFNARLHIRPDEEVGFLEAAAWLRMHAERGSRVMSRHPSWIMAMNGQRGLRWEDSFDPGVQRRVLIENGINWVIADNSKISRISGSQYLNSLLNRYPKELILRFESSQNPPTRVYQFLPE